MSISSTPASDSPEPKTRARGAWMTSKFATNPITRLVAYILSWFIFSTSYFLLVYALQAVVAVGGRCVSGHSAFQIRQYCPEAATAFLPWVIFTALIAAAIGLIFAYGIGIQLVSWIATILMGSLALLFFSGGGVEGVLLGLMFVVFAVLPLVHEIRASVPRLFIGSMSISGRQFQESPKAKKSLTQRLEPNPEGATRPTGGDWAISLLGFAIPAVAGYFVATLWVIAVVG
jgi:hypothetical protein